MKKYLPIIPLLFLCFISKSQDESSDKIRTISVTGSAEIVVQPDEIELEITLKEYGIQTNKKSLDDIEKKFFKVLQKHHIPQESIKYNSQSFYWYRWWTSYRNDIYEQRNYQLILKSDVDFMALMKDLDFKGISNVRISGTSNSAIQERRKEVKIAAIKAAKEKAEYLLDAIDEKLGPLVSVEEVKSFSPYGYANRIRGASNTVLPSNATDDQFENVHAIKLRYEVKAVFEVK